MKITDIYNIIIEEKKNDEYLLNKTHNEGKSKAIFFEKHGYDLSNKDFFISELLELLKKYEIIKIVNTDFGIKYIVDGEIFSKINKTIKIKTIWFVTLKENNARLVTTYPI
jgi:hypothetical protein